MSRLQAERFVRLPDAAGAALVAAAGAVSAGRAQPPPNDAGGWPMADDALALLTALVTELAPAHVVEFGSGQSTVALAASTGRLEVPGALTALENDPVLRRRTRAALDEAGLLSARVVVQSAPLVVRRVAGRHLPVYHLRRRGFASPVTPDLIVVDGPPSMLGGREGALLQALSLAGQGTLVLLDDADRPHETEALAAVTRRYGAALQGLSSPGFARGIAAFVVTAPIHVRVEPAR